MDTLTDAEISNCWNELRKLKPLANIPEERLRKEIAVIFLSGRAGLDTKREQGLLIAYLTDIKLSVEGLNRIIGGFDALGETTRTALGTMIIKFRDVQGRIGSGLTMVKMIERARELARDLDVTCEFIGCINGISVSKSGKLKGPHKSATRDMRGITLSAMRAWRVMTGRDVATAKGLEWETPPSKLKSRRPTKRIAKRPQNDDAYFVFLCLKLATGLNSPSKAITAINAVKSALQTLAKNPEAQTPFGAKAAEFVAGLDANIELVRRRLFDILK
jgi:hypothetical protein